MSSRCRHDSCLCAMFQEIILMLLSLMLVLRGVWARTRVQEVKDVR